MIIQGVWHGHIWPDTGSIIRWSLYIVHFLIGHVDILLKGNKSTPAAIYFAIIYFRNFFKFTADVNGRKLSHKQTYNIEFLHYVSTYVCMHVCICMYACKYVYVCVCVCVCIYIYIYIYTYMCTYLHTHTHIHTDIRTTRALGSTQPLREMSTYHEYFQGEMPSVLRVDKLPPLRASCMEI